MHESRAEMYIHLDEGRVPDAAKTVDLFGSDKVMRAALEWQVLLTDTVHFAPKLRAY